MHFQELCTCQNYYTVRNNLLICNFTFIIKFNF